MDSIKYQQIQKTKPDWLLDASYNGSCLDLPPRQQSKTNIKINKKLSHWAQNESFTMSVPVLWPEPCRRWVGERKRSTNMELWIWRVWRDSVWRKWSLISYQVFSKLFRHYKRKLRAVILGIAHCNNCGQHELEKAYISQWDPSSTFNCLTSIIGCFFLRK